MMPLTGTPLRGGALGGRWPFIAGVECPALGLGSGLRCAHVGRALPRNVLPRKIRAPERMSSELEAAFGIRTGAQGPGIAGRGYSRRQRVPTAFDEPLHRLQTASP